MASKFARHFELKVQSCNNTGSHVAARNTCLHFIDLLNQGVDLFLVLEVWLFTKRLVLLAEVVGGLGQRLVLVPSAESFEG